MRNRFSVLCIVLIIISLLTACGNIITGDKVQTSSSSEQVKQTSTPKPTFGGSASNVAKSAAMNSKSESRTKANINSSSTFVRDKSENNSQYEFTYFKDRVYESSGRIYWKALIEITNTGTNPLYLSSIKYDLTETNEDGRVLGTGTLSSFPDIIQPGEKGYFYDCAALSGVTMGTTVSFNPRWNIKTSKENRINFNLSDIEVREGQFGVTVFGKVQNKTGTSQSWAIISAILYAKDNTPIGVWMTNVMEDMLEETKIGFDISDILNRTLYDDVTIDMVDHYTIYAYPPQWQF